MDTCVLPPLLKTTNVSQQMQCFKIWFNYDIALCSWQEYTFALCNNTYCTGCDVDCLKKDDIASFEPGSLTIGPEYTSPHQANIVAKWQYISELL